jgi:hypothetical protein
VLKVALVKPLSMHPPQTIDRLVQRLACQGAFEEEVPGFSHYSFLVGGCRMAVTLT